LSQHKPDPHPFKEIIYKVELNDYAKCPCSHIPLLKESRTGVMIESYDKL
jgi:hypothetical protein